MANCCTCHTYDSKVIAIPKALLFTYVNMMAEPIAILWNYIVCSCDLVIEKD